MIRHLVVFCFVSGFIACSALATESQQRLVMQRTEGAHIHYAGELVLDGVYSYYGPNDEVIGDQVCFYPAKEFTRFIPRERNAHRDAWFCFRNTSKAKAIFAIDHRFFDDPTVCAVNGDGTVKITKYMVDQTEGNVNDLADLVEVTKKSQINIKRRSGMNGDCR
jgi:hypothetical protein